MFVTLPNTTFPSLNGYNFHTYLSVQGDQVDRLFHQSLLCLVDRLFPWGLWVLVHLALLLHPYHLGYHLHQVHP